MASIDWRRKARPPNPRNVGSSRTARNRIGETALRGWGGRIRTHKCRFQNWPLKCGPNSLHFGTFSDQRLFPAELPKSDLHPSPVHSAMNMACRSPLRCGQALLERRLLWIREFEFLPPQPPAGMSAVLAQPEIAWWRPNWLAGVGGFRTLGSRKPPLEIRSSVNWENLH
jgi:hypothetical protein